MSYFQSNNNTNNTNNMNSSGFYQPSSQFAFPQGSMSFQSGQTPTDTNMVPPDPLPAGLLNALSTKGYAYEPPLLEEIGINFDHIIKKTMYVLRPTMSSSMLSHEILNDSDLAGPVIFFMLFGLFLLMAGKVHFGYIYGVGLFGTISLHNLSKLMANSNPAQAQQSSLHFFNTASILGYCFLPLCLLSLFGVFHSLNNTMGHVMGALFVIWSTWSSSGFLNNLLQLESARTLIAYPLLIFYSVFALMAIFV
ncbi:Protein transport protein YIP1 [Nakaseomyces bracarensis]|uniref:Protein YIP n=1 Tax=Nakaseomyces bracarensis TaxID=273131 RepID=A0ABR4NP80_9SACH